MSPVGYRHGLKLLLCCCFSSASAWSTLPRIYVGPVESPRRFDASWPTFDIGKESCLKSDAVVSLTREQSHHLVKVLRVRQKQRDAVPQIRLVDRGQEWLADMVDDKTALCRESLREQDPTGCWMLLVPQRNKDRFRFVLEKCTELGVAGFCLITTDHTQPGTLKQRLDKVSAYLVHAAEQSERCHVPHVIDARHARLHEVLAAVPFPVYACRERYEGSAPLWSSQLPAECAFAVGPEGGFSASETAYLDKNTRNLSLGPYVLRVDTASMTAAAVHLLSQEK